MIWLGATLAGYNMCHLLFVILLCRGVCRGTTAACTTTCNTVLPCSIPHCIALCCCSRALHSSKLSASPKGHASLLSVRDALESVRDALVSVRDAIVSPATLFSSCTCHLSSRLMSLQVLWTLVVQQQTLLTISGPQGITASTIAAVDLTIQL